KLDAAAAQASINDNPSLENGEQSMQALQSARHDRELISNSPFGPEIIEAYAEKFPDASEEQLLQYAADTAAANDLSRFMSTLDVGWGDTAWAVAKSFLA